MNVAFKADTSLGIHPASVPETIYRRFFTAAIVVILTAGAVWGAVLLWQVARANSFTGVSIHAVNAHGHAQIFGWVGLFIMGFAYQAFPRMWGVRLFAPHMAVATFILMIFSLVLGTVGTVQGETWSLATPSVVIGGVMQSVASAIFAGQMWITFRRSAEPLSPAVGFMFAALVSFMAMSVMSAWHAVALIEAPSREALLLQISTYQAALRDVQIHGVALFMILGVSMRFFPGMFGIPHTPVRRGWTAFVLLVFALCSEVTLGITSRLYDSTVLAGLLLVSWIALAVGVALIVVPWKLWKPLRIASRSNKFVRTAYLWLAISLVMLLLLPVYMMMREMAFSHAYYGALRHAITVGFVSMMIMGVAAKVVPTLNGIDTCRLGALWGPFILVNTGCALRVVLQVLTDWHVIGFTFIGVSGTLEVIGLAWWGVGLIAIMLGWKPSASGSESTEAQPVPLGLNARLNVTMTVGEVARSYPQSLPTLSQLGLDTCCSAARTIEMIASERHIDPSRLLRAIVEGRPALANTETAQTACGCNCMH